MTPKLDIQDEQFWGWLHERCSSKAKTLPSNNWTKHLWGVAHNAFQLHLLAKNCAMQADTKNSGDNDEPEVK